MTNENPPIYQAAGHGLNNGDVIYIKSIDHRLWRRFLFWILRRPAPERTIKRVVSNNNSNTFTVNEEDKFSPMQGILISVVLGLALYALSFLAFW